VNANPLERIQVKGFKSIRELDLRLRDLNVFIGPNGAGKSNLIAVFHLLERIVNGGLQVYVGQAGGAESLLYLGRKTTSQIEIALEFGTNAYHCTLVPTAEDSLIFETEECSFHDRAHYSRPFSTSLGRGHKESLLHEAPKSAEHPAIADDVLASMRRWRVYHFHDTSASAKARATGDLEDNAILRDDASNLAAFLYLLRQTRPAYYEQIVDTVRQAAPFFDDFDLQPSRLNPDKIRLEWRQRGTDTYFGPHALSDGTLRFICLATVLLAPDPPAMILIDEPELGLHPYAITLLAALLRSAAQRTRVLVCTQSVTLVNQLTLDDIVVVDRQGQESVFTRPDAQALAAWLQEYGVGDLWEKNLLGGRP